MDYFSLILLVFLQMEYNSFDTFLIRRLINIKADTHFEKKILTTESDIECMKILSEDYWDN